MAGTKPSTKLICTVVIETDLPVTKKAVKEYILDGLYIGDDMDSATVTKVRVTGVDTD